MMRYAELHGNMQMRWIKSLRDNTLGLAKAEQLAESTRPLLGLVERVQDVMGPGSSISDALKGVGSISNVQTFGSLAAPLQSNL